MYRYTQTQPYIDILNTFCPKSTTFCYPFFLNRILEKKNLNLKCIAYRYISYITLSNTLSTFPWYIRTAHLFSSLDLFFHIYFISLSWRNILYNNIIYTIYIYLRYLMEKTNSHVPNAVFFVIFTQIAFEWKTALKFGLHLSFI